MDKFIFKTIWLSIISVMLFFFSGCDDDSDEFESSSSVVCTDWGASKSEVMDYMENFEMSVDENG